MNQLLQNDKRYAEQNILIFACLLLTENSVINETTDNLLT